MKEPSNEKASRIVWQGVQEISRVLAAMIALLTGLWMFGEAAAERYVTSVISAQHFPSQTEFVAVQQDIRDLKETDKDMRADQTSLGKIIEHQGAQIDSIEALAREQRELSSKILFELKKQ